MRGTFTKSTILVVVLCALGFMVSQFTLAASAAPPGNTIADSPVPTQPVAPTGTPTASGPTAAQFAAMAAEELKALPTDVVQVDCAPGVPTFPPGTVLTGFSAGGYILDDGRCFIDPSATPFHLRPASAAP